MNKNFPHRNSGKNHSGKRSQHEKNAEKHDLSPITVNYLILSQLFIKKYDNNQSPECGAC